MGLAYSILFSFSTIHSLTETLDPMFARLFRDNLVEMFLDEVEHPGHGVGLQPPEDALEDVPAPVQPARQPHKQRRLLFVESSEHFLQHW